MLSCLFIAALWERAWLLALLHVMISCVLFPFPCGVLDQVEYLIVWIPDQCLRIYFYYTCCPLKWWPHCSLLVMDRESVYEVHNDGYLYAYIKDRIKTKYAVDMVTQILGNVMPRTYS